MADVCALSAGDHGFLVLHGNGYKIISASMGPPSWPKPHQQFSTKYWRFWELEQPRRSHVKFCIMCVKTCYIYVSCLTKSVPAPLSFQIICLCVHTDPFYVFLSCFSGYPSSSRTTLTRIQPVSWASLQWSAPRRSVSQNYQVSPFFFQVNPRSVLNRLS